jgi:hypothetical protein
LKLLLRVKTFPKEVRAKPYLRRRITVHLRYEEGASFAVALPQKLASEARAIVAPLLRGPIEVADLVGRLQRLDAGATPSSSLRTPRRSFKGSSSRPE